VNAGPKALRVGCLLATLALGAATAHAEWAAGSLDEVPLHGNGQSWLVQATLNGTTRGLFLLDTGASLCVLSPGLARRLGLPPGGPQIDLRTANGVVRAPLVQLKSVDVGGNRARDIGAIVHNAVSPPVEGILGLSYLNRFRNYSVDPRRRVLRLQ
jgi:clan AA aspartic protease (TIGR02281 family)